MKFVFNMMILLQRDKVGGVGSLKDLQICDLSGRHIDHRANSPDHGIILWLGVYSADSIPRMLVQWLARVLCLGVVPSLVFH